MTRNIKSSPEGELKSLFTPLCKLFIGTLDVVAAADEMAGAFAVVDAGSGIVVSLGHTALFHHRVRQRDGRQQAAGIGVDGICKDLLRCARF